MSQGRDPVMHSFENFSDVFCCPNCEHRLPHNEFPQTCLECGFLIEVFLTREDAVSAIAGISDDADSITTKPQYVFGLGWVIGHTRLLLA